MPDLLLEVEFMDMGLTGAAREEESMGFKNGKRII